MRYWLAELTRRQTPKIKLDPKEHQAYTWATIAEAKKLLTANVRILTYLKMNEFIAFIFQLDLQQGENRYNMLKKFDDAINKRGISISSHNTC